MTTQTTFLAGPGVIPPDPVQIRGNLKNLAADMAAVRALLQAAVNVELFTIPLYMCAMKSIQGTHAINAKDVDYYKGRVWPGRSIGRVPDESEDKTGHANQTAYNALFSVFIDEMLHLQIAANLCSALREKPDFNSPALQDNLCNWKCYGPDQTIIPHIIDLKDLEKPAVQTVELRDLSPEQLALFMIIEQDDELARSMLKSEFRTNDGGKYFPAVPFANWTAQNTETDLPLFGTISWMYYCLLQYTTMKYEDNETLWDKMFGGQRDLFNSRTTNSSHPMAEFPLMPSRIGAATAHVQALQMIFGICDQGEGGIKDATILAYARMVTESGGFKLSSSDVVLPQYQPNEDALKTDYPSYDDTGHLLADSDDVTARVANGKKDHFERFKDLQRTMPSIVTWRQWHANASSKWTGSMLTTADYTPSASANIPTPDAVAAALNNLKQTDPKTLDNVVQGALAGITKVLSASWSDPTVAFPMPSMVGSGDRMALFWAVYGEAPTLRQSVKQESDGVAAATLYHACQSLSLDASGGAGCAAPSVYHSCKGSNHCATQGGCGFIQPVTGGGNCSASAVHSDSKAGGICGAPSLYSAPADNRCNGFGGCAVPISASQLFPDRTSQTMQLYDFDKEGTPVALPDRLKIEYGASVYETAWHAVETVRAHRDPNYKKQAVPPAPTDLRVALPPST
ncbi:ferritin-like domain-containing protein [Paraburkholderia bannensis]|uniref:ferritin-like domain-containing protein n=1 Tax=Paraburkholderia bannensis TaxID=765414 RepID=UPI002AC33FD5|nr:ferritin-like domain-containing protein [Paraburkholderia bannensis]